MNKKVERAAWTTMKGRCYNHRNPMYPRYGGRGIGVCDRWLESFDNFYADMGPRPGKGYSLDRINNDGSYEPGNCRWATDGEQARNKEPNVFIEHNGKRQCVADWSAETGIPRITLYTRVRNGWPADKVLDPNLHRQGKKKKKNATRDPVVEAAADKIVAYVRTNGLEAWRSRREMARRQAAAWLSGKRVGHPRTQQIIDAAMKAKK